MACFRLAWSAEHRWHSARWRQRMNSRPWGREGLCLPLLVAAWVTCAANGLTAPHHFQKWAEGELVRVDPQRHALAIRTPGASAEITVNWDNETRLYNESGTHSSHAGVTAADHLRPGEHLRVLYQNQGKDLFARRIVRRPEAEQVGRK